MLPTDNVRKANELVKTAEITGIRTQNGFIEVKCEFEDDVETPWMPYCLPFVGGTSIFCYPRIGQGGMILSEGGENHLNRFLPVMDTSRQFEGLGSHDFKILFENGDFIHHNSGTLTINSASTVVVNTQTATVNAQTITTNGNEVTINAPNIKCNGNVTIAGGLSQVAGADGSAGEAVFTAPVRFKAAITADEEVTVKGKAVSPHTHDTPAGQSGAMK